MLNKKEDSQFKDIQTEKRIHEHLGNEKDIISDEDINNVKTDVSEKDRNSPDDISSEEGLPQDDRPVKKSGRTDDPGIQTSWNILDQ